MLKIEILDNATHTVLAHARSIGNDLYQIEYVSGGIAGRKLFLKNIVADYFATHGTRVWLRVSDSMFVIKSCGLFLENAKHIGWTDNPALARVFPTAADANKVLPNVKPGGNFAYVQEIA